MNKTDKAILRAFLWELGIYAILVSVYFLCVLHFLGGWLYRIFASEPKLYALVTIVLMVGQAVALQIITSWLLRLMRKFKN